MCGVYRAHILQSEMEGGSGFKNDDEFTIFNDWETNRTKLQKENYLIRQQKSRITQHLAPSRTRVKPRLPSLEEVTTFYRDVFTRAKMETGKFPLRLCKKLKASGVHCCNSFFFQVQLF